MVSPGELIPQLEAMASAGRVSRGGAITGGIIPWDASAGASSQS